MAATLVLRGRAGSFSRLLTKSVRHDKGPKFLRLTLSNASCFEHGQVCAVIIQPHRTVFGFAAKKKEVEVSEDREVVPVPDSQYLEKEHFIPITRRSIVRHLMQEKDFLTADEFKKFENFALAMDSAIINRYHGLLQELKGLFDPINPDKDTIATRQWNRRERLDNEFWLLNKLNTVMAKANFNELSKSTVEKALAEHSSREGVMVSVNPDKYDVMRFWALGKEVPSQKIPIIYKIVNFILRRPSPKPLEYYKRVVVAVRMKKDDKLMLKAFKEVPINALEQLLPDGKIVMSHFDKTIIGSSLALAGAGIVAKVAATFASVQMDWTMLMSTVTALIAVRAWTVYKNRRNSYLLDLSRMLYFKNIANNRGLLTLLVDRAEDEIFKEVMLVYSFLLTNRSSLASASSNLPAEIETMQLVTLEKRIEEWVYKKTGTQVEFESSEAVTLLKQFGILSEDYDQNLHVLPLDGAMRNLPLTPQTLAPRIEEYDIVEGYERDTPHEVESEEDYKKDAKKRKLFGWF